MYTVLNVCYLRLCFNQKSNYCVTIIFL